ncbi:copper-translocating P-type ATPase [Oscillatoria sp. FACHB-1407]|uniref:heavy metal translocating P-type ATPase n=1 Tax=Oscillatoria sp. FACHB-1407 TaxID=2692847 RepID=UPI001684DBE3|nr:heavy metal translocating P-type ATPase [Oscillatoria sp. FACHB-1407]MBD2462331.1 copper-translocating P-type ATPase [Oscillatoria sp. FACHB-1407]
MQSPLLDTAPDITDTPANQTIALDVSGMKCAGCVKAVENQLTQYPGVVSATVNLVTEVAMVEYSPEVVQPTDLAHRLTDIGFPTQLRQSLDGDEPPPGYVDPVERHRQEAREQLWRVAIALVLLILSGIGHLDHFGWHIPGLSAIEFHWGLATLALIGPGRTILVDGWRGLRHNIPNMNSLIGLGAVTAYITSVVALLFPQLGWECFFDEPVMLLGFILLGRTLEQQARTRAAAAMQSLIALKPTLARLIPVQEGSLATQANGQAAFMPSSAVEIAAEKVKVGEWLQVLPGEKIPVDGQVIVGQTTVNEAMLTGESVPVTKQAGDLVAAGTLNQTGAIAIRATRTGKDTTIAQIIALVEAAQTRKAPIQGLADTIAGYFTYGVMAIALVTFLFWYFIGIPLFGEAAGVMAQSAHLMHTSSHAAMMPHPSPLLLSLKLAIAVLVIACPCALGLATPTAILVGCGVGAERGLLIRGGDVLENVHRLQTVVFDKTGTLTTGHPVITDCVPMGDGSVTRLLQLAATVESGTRHPLAEAIRQGAQQQELTLLPAENFQTEAGCGVSALIEGQMVRVGTADWLLSLGVNIPETAYDQSEKLSNAGKTPCFVAVDTTLIGLIAIQDTLRPDAHETVQQLQNIGLRVMMVTGDQTAVASAIAHSVGISPQDVVAEVRPEAKASIITQLQQQGTRVAMIGDGINDAPALAQADVSISLHSSTAVAIETAEIVLMRDRLQDVVEAIRLSRAAFNTIRQNLFWAFAYNIVGIPIAAGVLLPTQGIVLSPSVAGAIMAFSSVSVVTNSLFLRRMVKD